MPFFPLSSQSKAVVESSIGAYRNAFHAFADKEQSNYGCDLKGVVKCWRERENDVVLVGIFTVRDIVQNKRRQEARSAVAVLLIHYPEVKQAAYKLNKHDTQLH